MLIDYAHKPFGRTEGHFIKSGDPDICPATASRFVADEKIREKSK
jgi:hypothetical protein